ncbi:MAG: response regulator, partial [Planctomycetes bacterium]|nr:response regulator [Planctomycetota bacterium]
TVFAIVSNADGHIVVDSRLGEGTIFRVYLPYATGEVVEPSPEEGAMAEAPRAKGETILVCDDEELVLRSVCSLLEGRGYTVIAASDGRSALDLAAAHSGTIALLVTDVVMPEMNGRELARRLTQQRPETKVMFMSVYASDILDTGEDHATGFEFLEKPAPAHVLFQRVREVLDKDRSVKR